MFKLKNAFLIQERLTLGIRFILVKSFWYLGDKDKFLIGKPKVTYGFHKPIYQDDYLNTSFAFICQYFVLFFFHTFQEKKT